MPTAEPVTEQEIFDLVARGLQAQGGPSMDVACRYRSKDGRRCAVGLLIPDDLYRPALERCSVWDLGFPARLQQHGVFLTALQRAHDHPVVDLLRELDGFASDTDAYLTQEAKSALDAAWLPLWRKKMIELARSRNLSAAALESP